MTTTKRKGLLERLAEGRPVLGDGSMMMTLERRGYIKAGKWTVECSVTHHEAGNIYEYINDMVIYV